MEVSDFEIVLIDVTFNMCKSLKNVVIKTKNNNNIIGGGG